MNSENPPTPPEASSGYVYRDLGKISRWIRILLIVSIVMAFIAIVSTIFEYRLLVAMQEGNFESEEAILSAAEANDLRQLVIGFTQMSVAIAIGILSVIWLYRGNANVRALGATGLKFSPGWMVGWYFVPIANLWKPYQGMKELWQASTNQKAWPGSFVPSVLGWWWAFFLIQQSLGKAAFRQALRAEDFDELLRSDLTAIAADAVSIPASLLGFALTGAIYSLQRNSAEALVKNWSDGSPTPIGEASSSLSD